MNKCPPYPSFPRLQYGVETLAIGQDKVLVRSFSGSVMLTGDFVERILPALLPLLDGKRSVDELTSEVGEEFRPGIEDFLALMGEKGLLGSTSSETLVTPSAKPLAPRDRAYWSLYSATTADQAANRLWRSTVVVAGLGEIGAVVAGTLAASGVGNLILVGQPVAAATDPSIKDGVEARDCSNAESLAKFFRNKHSINVATLPTSIDDAPNWDEVVAKADIVAVCSDNMSMAGYDRTNEACIKHSVRWTSARIDRQRAMIGPFVVPQQTACFSCFEARSRANATHPDDHEALYRHWKNVRGCPQEWPFLTPFAGIVGNFLALDLLRVLAGQHLSSAAGRVIYLELPTMERTVHEVLKLPRCAACSRLRSRPPTKIWDIAPAEARSVS